MTPPVDLSPCTQVVGHVVKVDAIAADEPSGECRTGGCQVNEDGRIGRDLMGY